MQNIIYHITTNEAWAKAVEQNYYEAPSLIEEGFIHCSTENQVNGVLNRYYKDTPNLLKLVIEISKLTSELKYELAPSVNELFPHIYGPIQIEAVISVIEL